MKSNPQKFIASFLLMVIMLPSLVFAKDTGVRTETNFCTHLSTLKVKLANQITDAEAKQVTNQQNRIDKIIKKESDTDAKRAEVLLKIDSKRLANWDKMRTIAKTDAQKSAITTYKDAVTKAVTDRRSMVDQAIKAYRSDLSSFLSTHSVAINNAVTTFKASVTASLIKAESNCTSKMTPTIVKETFYKTVSDARVVLRTDKENAEMSIGLANLKKTRDDAIKSAEQSFKTSIEKARADLLIALK